MRNMRVALLGPFCLGIGFALFSCGTPRPQVPPNLGASTFKTTNLYECGEVCSNRVLIKFGALDQNKLNDVRQSAEELTGAPVKVDIVGDQNVVAISGDGVDPVKFLQGPFLQTFNNKFNIEYVEPDFVLRLHSVPQDEFFKLQWGLKNDAQTLTPCGESPPKGEYVGLADSDIHVLQAWSTGHSSNRPLVAILDGGVDSRHPDLKGNLWSAPVAFDLVIGGKPVHCEAGSHGFNSVSNRCEPDEAQYSHGTNVAGIAGAIRDDRVGTVGVNSEMSIIDVKAFVGDAACVSQIVNAIQFIVAVKNNPKLKANIQVINNSYGFAAQTIGDCKLHETCQSRILRDAVRTTLSSGILFIASAGNSTRDTDCIPEFPANFDLPNVMAVGASTNHDVLADFSNFGVNSTHLLAPGQDICAPGIGGYGYQDGTSMSAPFVTGSASLLLARCDMSMSYSDLKRRLLDTADVVKFKFKGHDVQGRRLNVGRALISCVEESTITKRRKLKSYASGSH